MWDNYIYMFNNPTCMWDNLIYMLDNPIYMFDKYYMPYIYPYTSLNIHVCKFSADGQP